MGEKIVFFLLSVIFFVIYLKAFDFIFLFISPVVPFDQEGLVLFMLQIFFSIVILFPASIMTTKKIFEIIRST